MRVNEHVRADRQGGRRGRRSSRPRLSVALAATLASAMTFATGLVLAGPAAATPATPATDDGEDLSDLMVDEVDGYDLQPRGDPTQGRSGPIDWDDMGGIPGLGTDELPSDMATYVHTFIADDYDMFVLLMGLDIGDLPPSAVVAGAAVGMRQYGGEEGAEIVLPDADQAEVDYEARDMTDPGDPEGLTYSAAAMADDDIVVLVMVTSYDHDIPGEHRELDRFVTAQAAYEPPPEGPRSGGFGDDDEDEDPTGATGGSDDETAADQAPAEPASSRQPVDDGGSNARQNGLLAAVGILLIGLGLLIRYLVVYRLRPAAAAQAQAAVHAQGPVATPATWWPLVNGGGGGPRPPVRTPMPRHPPMAPPLPPADAPPLAPRPAPPVPRGDGWRLPG